MASAAQSPPARRSPGGADSQCFRREDSDGMVVAKILTFKFKCNKRHIYISSAFGVISKFDKG